MIDIISIVTSAVSIISAIVSVIHAFKAKKEKKEAQKIKEYIFEKYDNYNDSQLRVEIINLSNDLSKIREKSLEKNPLTTGRNLFDDISELLIKLQSQKIYEIESITNSVKECRLIIANLDKSRCNEQISDLIGHLTGIARHIDKSIRSI